MAGILRGIFRFHKYLNPEDYTSYEQFANSAKYSGYTGAGTIGAGFAQDAAYGRRIKYKTGVTDWLANRLKHGITTSIPERASKRQKTSMSYGYGNTGSNTVAIRRKKGKWPKRRKIERTAARLRYINDATGEVSTLAFKIAALTPVAAINASKTSIVTVCTGGGGGMTNKGDLNKIFPIALNKVPASSIAGMRVGAQHVYLRSVHLNFDVSMLAGSDGTVEMYECICLKDVGNGEITMTTGDTFQDDWLARSPATLGTTTGTAAPTNVHPMNTPYFWHEFGAYYKITQVSKFSIQGGKSVQFDRHFNVNKIIDADVLSGNDHFKRLTRLYIFVVRGVSAGAADLVSCTAAINIFATYKFTSRDVAKAVLTVTATDAT